MRSEGPQFDTDPTHTEASTDEAASIDELQELFAAQVSNLQGQYTENPESFSEYVTAIERNILANQQPPNVTPIRVRIWSGDRITGDSPVVKGSNYDDLSQGLKHQFIKTQVIATFLEGVYGSTAQHMPILLASYYSASVPVKSGLKTVAFYFNTDVPSNWEVSDEIKVRNFITATVNSRVDSNTLIRGNKIPFKQYSKEYILNAIVWLISQGVDVVEARRLIDNNIDQTWDKAEHEEHKESLKLAGYQRLTQALAEYSPQE
jgi:hypothetical protein